MGKLYPNSTRWKKNIVVFLHLFGARSNLSLFYDHRDNESDSQEIKIGISGPIFILLKIKGLMGQ